jgi:hypothetical protein
VKLTHARRHHRSYPYNDRPVRVDGCTARLLRLRGEQLSTGFIERWVDAVLFYDAPTWVFTVAYVAFAALVVITWIVVPPTLGKHKR